MTRPARREDGFTLVEVLLAMLLMGVIVGATLSVFAAMERNSRLSQDTNALQDETRFAVDRLAKQLRNLASQADDVFRPIERATPTDLVFRTIASTGTGTSTNPTNIQRVRYCLSGSTLHAETQALANASAAPALPTACPGGSGWSTQALLSGAVVNGSRPIFNYMLAVDPVGQFVESSTVTAAEQLERVIGVRSELFVDDDLRRRPRESTLTTRVFLRNQNRKPTASFVATQASGMSLQLNGGDSVDPEGGRLTFEWFDNAKVGTDKKIGEGAVFVYSTTAGTHPVYLRVTDAAGNTATTAVTTYDCQTTTGCVTT